jgi:hypothetical protein
MKMKLKISQQQVLAPVFLVYTLQTDNNLTNLNETILENAFHLVELILGPVFGNRYDTTRLEMFGLNDGVIRKISRSGPVGFEHCM